MTQPAASTLFMSAEAEALPAREAAASLANDPTAALTRRLASGEEEAWREFHDRYFDRLLRYLLVVCRGDEHAARESLQAALVKIVRHVRCFDREEIWWSWLTVVARSCVVDGARRQSRYRALLARYAGWLTPLDAPPGEDFRSLPACFSSVAQIARYDSFSWGGVNGPTGFA